MPFESKRSKVGGGGGEEYEKNLKGFLILPKWVSTNLYSIYKQHFLVEVFIKAIESGGGGGGV